MPEVRSWCCAVVGSGKARDMGFIEMPLTQLCRNNYSFAYDPKHTLLNYNYGCSLTDLEVQLCYIVELLSLKL
jgi:hypothetical protein